MRPAAVAPDGAALPAYMTVGEVAALLSVGRKTVYRLVAQDASVPCLRLGGVLRFPREKLFAWLESRTQGTGRPRRRLRAAP